MRLLTSTFALLLILAQPLQAEEIVIGTGSKSGVYYQAGRALCQLLKRSPSGLGCKAEETAGSVFNLSNVQGGAIEFGIAQSDMQFHAVKQSGPFEFVGTSYGNIRSLFSLYKEPFTLVVRRDAGIENFDDLKGRRVNIGNPGSGQRATMEIMMQAKGWTKKDFLLVTELPASQQSLSLCHDRVQAMVYTVGHPNPSVSKAIALCNALLAQVTGPEVDKLVAGNPYYSHTEIPGGLYQGNPDPVNTFGVMATVVSSTDVEEETVYQLVKTVFENLDKFRKMHSSFALLDEKKMISDGLSAPLHEGAKRYYRERGWM